MSRASSTVRAVALVAAGAIGATALTGMAFAAVGGTQAQSAVAASGAVGAPAHRGPGLHDVLHGDLVVRKADGGVATVRVQQGSVTTSSTTALTVRSEDGYAAAYVLTSATVIRRDGATVTGAGLKPDDVVQVAATVAGGSATATRVRALSPTRAAQLADRRESLQQWWSQRPEGTGPGAGGLQGLRRWLAGATAA